MTDGEDREGRRQRALVLQPRAAGQRDARRDGGARSDEGRLAEAVGLAQAIALDVADAAVLPLRRPTPATLFGPGRVRAVGEEVAARGVDLVIVDAPLTPVQQRNLERAWK